MPSPQGEFVGVFCWQSREVAANRPEMQVFCAGMMRLVK